VLVGVGNGSVEDSLEADDSSSVLYEGAVQGSIIGTYLHGPALARNPQLADYLLAEALGVNPGELAEIEMPLVERLRSERLEAVGVEEEN
jgi:CobQ-like glutamine amidotransferase family enzyme